MKILIVVPTFNYSIRYPTSYSISDFPVGLAYIASSLKFAGFQVFGLNPNNDSSFPSANLMLRSKIENKINEIHPDIICTGGICTDYAFLKDAINFFREFSPKTPVVLGGGIVTHDRDFIFTHLKPDFCVSGEAEETLVHLVNAIHQGSIDFEEIPNIGYWSSSNPKYTKLDFSFYNWNIRPFPDYEPFDIDLMLDQYSRATRNLYRYTRSNPRPFTIVTGRGCPFSCTFCVHNNEIKYRARLIKDVLEEIKILHERYHFNILIIMDELFAANKTRLNEFSDGVLLGKKIYGWDFDWTFQTHASANFDKTCLELAKSAGCFFFSYGLESASPKILESMNKRTKPAQFIEAINLSESAKIGFGGNFIFGDVAETSVTVKETMTFFNKYCKNIHVFFASIHPYPGSQLFEHCIKNGIISDKIVYYETQLNNYVFNMTRFPDSIWLAWTTFLRLLGNSFLWSTFVEPTAYSRIEEPECVQIERSTGTALYEIEAQCPFCNLKSSFREFYGEEKIKYTSSILSKFRWKIRSSEWFFPLVMFILRNTFKLHPLFKTLVPITETRRYRFPNFITGCPSCNKRFFVKFPAGMTNK